MSRKHRLGPTATQRTLSDSLAARRFQWSFGRARLFALLAIPIAGAALLIGLLLATVGILPAGVAFIVFYVLLVALLAGIPAYARAHGCCPHCGENLAVWRNGFPFHTPGSCPACGKLLEVLAPPVISGRRLSRKRLPARPTYHQVAGVPYGRRAALSESK